MKYPEPSISVDVDAANPGQFFACCALLALADRLWPGAEGWFIRGEQQFLIAAGGSLEGLISRMSQASMEASTPEDTTSSPVLIGDPFHLSIDWWETDLTGARDLKVWAGTMESYGIARALQQSMRIPAFWTSALFDEGMVVANSEDSTKKKEPFCFDCRRADNAHSRDVGFSPNDLSLTSIAHPAVELLCLIGLQFARPVATTRTRVYEYWTWPAPVPANVILAASTGSLQLPGARGFRFENWFRTGQRKHKAFKRALPISQERP